MDRKGVIIAIEGIDGAGKTTLARRLERFVRNEVRRNVVFTSAISDEATRFGQWIGSQLRFVDEEYLADVECALMIAARVDNMQRVIVPALEDGDVVISDRFKTSLFVYQRDCHGNILDRRLAESRLQSFGLGRDADLTLILDIDPDRVHKPFEKSNRLENRTLDDWDTMRMLFREECYETANTVLIDASKDVDQVEADARRHVASLLNFALMDYPEMMR